MEQNSGSGREALFAANRHLCRRGARKFYRRGLELADLEQVAAIGLLKACDRFDPRVQVPFEAFAWLSVVGELMHYVRDSECAVRIPRSLRGHVSLSFASIDALPGFAAAEPQSIDLDDRILLDDALARLDPLRRRIVVAIYALGYTHVQLARKIALSPGAVSRRHREALHLMREAWYSVGAPSESFPLPRRIRSASHSRDCTGR